LLFADHASAWREEITEALQGEGVEIVLTQSAVELQQALEGSDPPRVVVVGDELEGGGGDDALYAASQKKSEKADPQSPPLICRLTQIRADSELLDLMRSRGVRHFVYRDDPIDNVLRQILNVYHGLIRRSPRYDVKLPARAFVDGTEIAAIIEDVSLEGCRFGVRQAQVPRPLLVGERVRLCLEAFDLKIDEEVQVMRVNVGSRLEKSRLFVGIGVERGDESSPPPFAELIDAVNRMRDEIEEEVGLSLDGILTED